MAVNKVILLGNLGADPELRHLPNGTAVVNLSVATSERWKDKTTGESVEKTEWHRVSFFDRQAEVIGEYFRKGSQIYVEGRLQTRKYQDKEGNDRYITEIRGNTFSFVDRKGDSGGGYGGAAVRVPVPAGDTGRRPEGAGGAVPGAEAAGAGSTTSRRIFRFEFRGRGESIPGQPIPGSPMGPAGAGGRGYFLGLPQLTGVRIGGEAMIARVTRYFKRDRVLGARFRRLLRLFALDLTPAQIAALTRLSPNTVARDVRLFRERIAAACDAQAKLSGVVEVDESYFGGRHAPGRRGRGTRGKVIVFGMCKRDGQVRAEAVANCRKAMLGAVLRAKAGLASVIHSDAFSSYNSVAALGDRLHHRVHHRREFARGECHINGIESFWGYCKLRLARCHGVPRQTFRLRLKECEFRFNPPPKSGDDLYKILLKLCRD